MAPERWVGSLIIDKPTTDIVDTSKNVRLPAASSSTCFVCAFTRVSNSCWSDLCDTVWLSKGLNQSNWFLPSTAYSRRSVLVRNSMSFAISLPMLRKALRSTTAPVFSDSSVARAPRRSVTRASP